MFENAGKKIRMYAKIIFTFNAIVSFICAVVFGHLPNQRGVLELNFWLFLAILVGGTFSSYIITLFISAFGEGIECTSKLNEQMDTVIHLLESNAKSDDNTAQLNHKEQAKASLASGKVTASAEPIVKSAPNVLVSINANTIKCPLCGTEQRSNSKICYNCGAKFIPSQDNPQAIEGGSKPTEKISTMKCPDCGKLLPSNRVKCDNCGRLFLNNP